MGRERSCGWFLYFHNNFTHISSAQTLRGTLKPLLSLILPKISMNSHCEKTEITQLCFLIFEFYYYQK